MGSVVGDTVITEVDNESSLSIMILKRSQNAPPTTQSQIDNLMQIDVQNYFVEEQKQ